MLTLISNGNFIDSNSSPSRSLENVSRRTPCRLMKTTGVESRGASRLTSSAGDTWNAEDIARGAQTEPAMGKNFQEVRGQDPRGKRS